MIRLKYSLIIEATSDSAFFGFYSPDLLGFSGVGSSIDDCIEKARAGMEEHIEVLRQRALPVPNENPNPQVIIHDERPRARTA